ncbi:type II toxin-antitoxin system HigB family toxin [Rudanella paleaurantiibacter]|uniref:Type II toxin-antitoxin system HigB family toxin n=1 Tax=Rudanella paleaurantiibacter TaxID=2614655 RepID=A0A7J5TWA7_9BACT|nr:type II toxin-antitoxin system HigB family toxin [Rudanella paleaurantiibacter]KAB7728726.1 type II toxin-antitoxin system HigB family toxin [Rudanella paleaurantiibacter]
MVIISKTMLNEFAQRHPDVANALNEWYDIVSKADWQSFADVRQTFNHADYVGNDRFVFNVKGNQYRIVGMIFFDKRTLFVRFVGTHAQYDKINCSVV